MAAKKGRQTPTQSVVLQGSKTLGPKAVKLYKGTGRTVLKWQADLLKGIMSVNSDGLWTHTKCGYSLPRRNGKSEILVMREMYGLANGEHILHTAHRTTTSHTSWEKLVAALARAGLKEKEDYVTSKQFGLETISMLGNDGKICFRTRSSKGGLGEGYDLLVIDEAQEYTDDQASALKYVVTDSKNPQTVMCGTPPTPVSAGTVFTKMRNKALDGESENTFWAEWSVESQVDPSDKTYWYECNPSLGYIFTERSIKDEIGDDDVDFNIQRLGLWIKYNLKSVISEAEWNHLLVKTAPATQKNIYVGIKYGNDGANVALSVASKVSNSGKIFVESIDCRPVRAGTKWITEILMKMKNVGSVAIDGANGQQILSKNMQDLGLKKPVLPSVKEIIVANSLFEQALYSETICHSDQPSLTNVVSNCDKRNIGSNGGFGYKSIKPDTEIALMDSVILAHWLAHEAKEPKKQTIKY